jgi:hypothetical protein
VLTEFKRVLKEDAGLELNISKTSILPKPITQQAIFDVAHGFINATPQLTQLSGEVSLDSFRPDGFVGIGVPIGTDTFARQFVDKTYREIIEDVEKLDAIEDDFIHFQLLRFCQTTRMQFLNSHVILDNRCVLKFHLTHTEGGFGVSFNFVTKDGAFYTTTSLFVSWMGTFSQVRQELWLPKDDLRDSSSWSSSPLNTPS